MKDVVLSPEEVLSWPHEVDLLNARPWHADWTGTDLAVLPDLMRRLMPATVPFHTSGSTGEPRPWVLEPHQMLAEVISLADVLAPDGLDGVVAFAPPRHRYGAHCSLLLPAALGCPVWVRPRSTGSLPPLAGGRWLVVAIPSTFAILRRRLDWLAAADRVTILHSSARLPAVAHDLLADLTGLAGGPGPTPPSVDLVELLGSTETGAVATRRHPEDRWRLVPPVDFAAPRSPVSPERLTVRSPWLARTPRAHDSPGTHELDDLVERVGDQDFNLLARSGRIVKVNGRRHDLDDVAARFGRQLGGREVACIAVADPLVGEHFELYVVAPTECRADLNGQIRRAIDTVGLHPRRVRLVTEILTSATGKIVLGQTTIGEDPQP